jgi:hypothetical protein
MERGEVAEFDTPRALLTSSDGAFTSMINALAPEEAELLRKRAASSARQ